MSSTTKTPNLQVEKLNRSQNKRQSQVQNRKFLVNSSNKLLKDFSSGLNADLFKGQIPRKNNTLKKDLLEDDDFKIPYRKIEGFGRFN